MSAADPIYLDYAATSPVDPLVIEAMNECLGADGEFANPGSTTHLPGRRARARVERARAQVAGLIGADPSEIIFTSGATESNNLALLGVARAHADRGRHIVSSRIEHRAVLDPCRRLEREGFTVSYLEPDSAGRIRLDELEAALRPETALVSLMHVNNETGVVADIAAFAALCQARGVPLHADGAQSVGKLPVDVRALNVDFLSFTAHKIYGPKGIGALYVRAASRPRLAPVSFGGGQERGMRPGTLATHQIVGFGQACELAARRSGDAQRLALLRDRLWMRLSRLLGVHLNGAAAKRVPSILSVSFEGVEGESLISALPELAVSTGSACSSASAEPSYVLRALGRSSSLAQSTLRFSFGRATTEEDIDHAAQAVVREVARLRAVSPAYSEKITADRVTSPQNRPVIEFDALSPEVRQLFSALPGAGVIEDAAGQVIRGEAGGLAQEAWVRFHLLVTHGTVKDARFQAYGCPHTLAVSAWLTGQLPGRRLSEVLVDEPAQWARVLSVPIEKLGRLLVVEDALRACTMTQRSTSEDDVDFAH
jgi:cysteine desulfurase